MNSVHLQAESAGAASPDGGIDPTIQLMEQELLGDDLQTANRDEYDNDNLINLMASTGTEKPRGTQNSTTCK